MAMVAPKTAGKGARPSAGLSLYVDVDDTSVEAVLLSLERGLSGPSLSHFLNDDVSDYFKKDLQERFYDEGDNKSGAWEPLADSTQDIRAALGYNPSHPINERTGELKDFVINERETTFGTMWATLDVPGGTDNPVTAQKLKTAQQGSTDNKWGGSTPPRPVLAANETDLAAILTMLELHLVTFVASGWT